jgi:predicted DNA-binding transcriptional regulator AlpA
MASEDVVALKNSGLRVMVNQDQLLTIIPVSPTTLWRMEKKGEFPKSTFISANRRVWYLDEIVAWQEQVNGRGRGRRNQSQRERETAPVRENT